MKIGFIVDFCVKNTSISVTGERNFTRTPFVRTKVSFARTKVSCFTSFVPFARTKSLHSCERVLHSCEPDFLRVTSVCSPFVCTVSHSCESVLSFVRTRLHSHKRSAFSIRSTVHPFVRTHLPFARINPCDRFS